MEPNTQQVRDLTGRTFLVTGANTGIGRATAEALARRGGRIWLGCRSEEKTRPVIDGIRASGGAAEFLSLDLGDLASVRSSAQTFLATGESLDVLINNAGLAGARGLTRDGFEITFGTNHLGPFLFTTLLLPRLRESKNARIANVSSHAHRGAKALDWEAFRKPTASATGFPEYGVSKLCNVLFTKELARGRAGAGITSYALHPGGIASDIWREVPAFIRWAVLLLLKTPEQGARTSIACATAPELASQDGRYYSNEREARTSRLADDPDLARELWARSEAWTRE